MFSYHIQSKDLAHQDTTVWISDYQLKGVQRAVVSQQKMGLLEIKNTFHSSNNIEWVEVRYLNF